MDPARNRFFTLLMLASLAAATPAMAQRLKLYVFDTGTIPVANPAGFHLTRAEVGEPDMSCASYLIVHTAAGRTETLLWDSGLVPDDNIEAGKAGTKATKTLKSQLAEVG